MAKHTGPESSSPFVVTTLVQRNKGKPAWATFPADGIYAYTEGQYIVPESKDGCTVLPFYGVPELIAGNARHSGTNSKADVRIPTHERGRTQLNLSAVSVVLQAGVDRIVNAFDLSEEDGPYILRDLLPPSDTAERVLDDCSDDPRLATAMVIGHCLGANLVVGGTDRLTVGNEVGPYTFIYPEDEPVLIREGALYVTGINRPCRMPAGLLSRVYGLDRPQEVVDQFETELYDDRGYIAAITEDGAFMRDALLLDAPYRA